VQPATYLLGDADDLDRLRREHEAGTVYLLKAESHRQTGLHLAWDLEEVEAKAKETARLRALGQAASSAERSRRSRATFTVAQRFLTDPYTVEGHSVTLRLYLLVARRGERTLAWLYEDGKVNYSHKPFALERPAPGGAGAEKGFDQAALVASGYGVPSFVYERFPYSFKELLERMRGRGEPVDATLLPGLERIFARAVEAAAKRQRDLGKAPGACSAFGGWTEGARKRSCLDGAIYFQHFGCDVAVSETLRPWLLEANKGPDMKAIRDDVANGLFAGVWRAVGTHGPAPEWASVQDMRLVYDDGGAGESGGAGATLEEKKMGRGEL
jgi:hypothetical protein